MMLNLKRSGLATAKSSGKQLGLDGKEAKGLNGAGSAKLLCKNWSEI
jgi:hypothetical protein